MVHKGLEASGFEEVGLLSLSSADHSEIAEITKGLADRYEGTQTGLSLPSHPRRRVQHRPRQRAVPQRPALRADVRARGRQRADPPRHQQDGVRGGPHPDGQRRVRGNGWRQVKLYFMCGLPTETDDDVLQIAAMAQEVIRAGREASGRKDIRCTISIGGFVPKPHTPFQWAAQCDPDTVDDRLRKLREAVNSDRRHRPQHRHALPRRQAEPHRRPALPRRPPRRPGHRAGLARGRPVRRLERALLLRALDVRGRRGARAARA